MRLAAETATGVAYLHSDEIKIVHGDLKAANVLLTAEHSGVRICDFGMAEAKDRSKSMTSVGMGSSASAGITVAWTAPEVLQNEDKSFASDGRFCARHHALGDLRARQAVRPHA